MLTYRIEGHGPDLLLIHGFGISFNIWNELKPLLRDHFTLIMVELPGIGRTPGPEPGCDYLSASAEGIEEVRAHLGIDSWRVLGYSSGTRVAERYFALHANRVTGGVLLCPAQTPRLAARVLGRAIDWDHRSPKLGDWLLSGWRIKFLINLFAFNLGGGPSLQEWFKIITSQPVEILKETLRSVPDGWDAEFRVPAGLQCLYIWGRHDLITASPHCLTTAHRLIQARHSAPQTDAPEVAETLFSFFNGGVSE